MFEQAVELINEHRVSLLVLWARRGTINTEEAGSYIVRPFSEPIWPRGKALGWKAEGPRFESASALLSLQKLWSVDTVF